MKLTFLGGTEVVTGAMYLLETKDTKIVVDCGLFQGSREWRVENFKDFGVDPSTVDHVLITHSHMDHVGRVPKFVKDGFKGNIYAVEPAVELSHAFLLDSAHLQTEEAKDLGVDPLYSPEDVLIAMKQMKPIKYYEEIKLSETIKIKYNDAGHILGSGIIEVWAEDQKIVFTGDLGNPPVPILKPYDFIEEADYVIIESAYGDRNHEPVESRRDLLENAIEDTFTKGGVLMIPAFAMERTQEILYEMNHLFEKNKVPKIPIFLDSPLAIKATEIFKKYERYFNKETSEIIKSGDDIFNFPGLKITRTSQESKTINAAKQPKIIIAGSGMSTGGRILHHELRYLEDPNNMLFIVGYQVAGTLGRRLLDGEKYVTVMGTRVRVNAEVRALGAYSAHADQKQLLNWVSKIKTPVKEIFVVQGEEKAAKTLAAKITENFKIKATVPRLDDSVEL